MKIKVNNEEKTTDSNSLSEILQEVNLLEKTGIAVALNHEVISKEKWPSTKLNENDNIIIITATQGG